MPVPYLDPTDDLQLTRIKTLLVKHTSELSGMVHETQMEMSKRIHELHMELLNQRTLHANRRLEDTCWYSTLFIAFCTALLIIFGRR